MPLLMPFQFNLCVIMFARSLMHLLQRQLDDRYHETDFSIISKVFVHLSSTSHRCRLPFKTLYLKLLFPRLRRPKPQLAYDSLA